MHPYRKFDVRYALSRLLFPVLLVPSLRAQIAGSSVPAESTKLIDQVFPLKNTRQPAETKELIIVLRNVLDARATISLLAGQDAIVVNDTPDQLRLARKVIDDIESAQPSVPAQPASAAFATGKQTTMHPDLYHTAEQTLYLARTVGMQDEIQLTATLRQTVNPTTKIYLLPTQHAVVVNATPDGMEGVRAEVSRLVPGWSATLPNSVSVVYPIKQASTSTDQVLEQTMYLPAALSRESANEVLVALRNIMDPDAKIYFLMSKNALVMTATENQLELAHKVMKDLDPNRPGS